LSVQAPLLIKGPLLKAVLDTYRKAEDLINIGAYVSGSNPKIDYAIDMIDRVNGYLRQDITENAIFDDSIKQLEDLFSEKPKSTSSETDKG